MDNIPDHIKNKLLSYQAEHVVHLVHSLKTHSRVLDASDTGTGKTYSAIAACIVLGYIPFIVCPKSVISSWINVLKFFDANYYGITNYESLQNCKYFTAVSNGKTICPYITRTVVKNEKKEKKSDTEYTYTWQNIPENMVIIFDEAHRCKNPKTLNSVILYTLAKHTVKIMMLSATLSDKPENFALAGFVLGLYKNVKDSTRWMERVGKGHNNVMMGVHGVLYDEYACRMRIRDLGKLFPDNQVIASCYDMDNAEEIQEQYRIIEEEVERLKTHEKNSGCILAAILYARMKIEMLKVPTMIEEAKKYLDENNSVAIFVNFTDTLKTIADELKTNCLIYGQQTIEERNKAISDFNDDKSQIIICNIVSGGTGVSLHDQKGDYPRVSIVSPSWSAQTLIQALGRVHRANGKTPVRQRIIFCKGTIEETICENMKEKIKNIALLNDGDLLSYNIEGLTDDLYEVGVDRDGNLSEFDKLVMKMNVLNIKKQRLEEDLRITVKDIEETVLKFMFLSNT